MTTKLQLTAKGSDATKTFTISNPIPAENFTEAAAKQFVNTFDDTYDSDLSLTKAVYITTSETTVYPAA